LAAPRSPGWVIADAVPDQDHLLELVLSLAATREENVVAFFRKINPERVVERDDRGLQESNGDEFRRGFQSVSAPDQPYSRRAA
jgi:hypothetical protein